MFNWAKQQLANVAGTQEPIYGPEAIRSVAQQAAETPYTEATREHLKWPALEQTSVATQVFYMLADSGHIAMAQVIYSSVAGLRTTVHFNTKVFYPNQSKPILWSKDPLHDFGFDEDGYSFFGEGCSIDLAEDGKSYTIKSAVNDKCLVDIKMTRVAPGFVVGKDGTSSFGTDPNAPWGVMRHAFWPRCKVEGHYITKDGQIDFKGAGLFIHAFQGMKPHHAAAKWNFSYFQGPTHSAIMMEYITPPSYGTTVVNVAGVVTDDKIVFAGAQGTVTHTEKKEDPENQWLEPLAATYSWKGKDSNGKDMSAEISGSLGNRMDRIDIMSEVPGFIKSLVANAAGTKPYIYQWAPTNKTLTIKTGDEEAKEEGKMFIEATFIS